MEGIGWILWTIDWMIDWLVNSFHPTTRQQEKMFFLTNTSSRVIGSPKPRSPSVTYTSSSSHSHSYRYSPKNNSVSSNSYRLLPASSSGGQNNAIRLFTTTLPSPLIDSYAKVSPDPIQIRLSSIITQNCFSLRLCFSIKRDKWLEMRWKTASSTPSVQNNNKDNLSKVGNS